jgi:Bacterial Ig-like domain
LRRRVPIWIGSVGLLTAIVGVVSMPTSSAADDVTAPTVTINQGVSQPDPTSVSPVVFTVVFSEPVFGFTAADVSLSGSTAGGTLLVAVSGSGADYSVSVTGMTTGGTVVATIPAGGAVDAASNPNTASTSVDNTVTWQSSGQTATPDATPTSGGLPVTGNDVRWLVTLSIALIAAGIVTLVAVRRRSANES